jgi:GR25 family glycosyltransferase involved in LPS biosynthesis
MRIFVVHYIKLVKRKEYIIKQLNKHNLNDYEFIEIDRDELDNYDTSKFETNYDKCQIAISLSHFYAYKKISENYDNALILEDDVILHPNFTNILNVYLSQLPKDYDMLFIGNGCNLHIPKNKLVPKKFIYEKCLNPTKWGGDGASRCTDSYLMSKKCAIKICNYVNNLSYKIRLPIDWWLNLATRDNIFKVYWAEPTIVTQGTQNGLFVSSH